jgi:oligosaccharide 4-alpha-D-glucosyltransferase
MSPFIRMRAGYSGSQLLPYNYTMAFDNSQTGMPLMRPVLFEEPDGDSTPTISSTYL